MKKKFGLILFVLALAFGAVGCEECNDCDGTLDFCEQMAPQPNTSPAPTHAIG